MKAEVNDTLVFSDHVLYQTFLPSLSKSDLLLIDALKKRFCYWFSYILLVFVKWIILKGSRLMWEYAAFWNSTSDWFQLVFFWVPLQCNVGFCFWILVCCFYAISSETLTIKVIVASVILGRIFHHNLNLQCCAELCSNEQEPSVVDSYGESFFFFFCNCTCCIYAVGVKFKCIVYTVVVAWAHLLPVKGWHCKHYWYIEMQTYFNTVTPEDLLFCMYSIY